MSYSELLEKSGLDTLEKRRDMACEAFAVGLCRSERYQEWLPRRETVGVGLRRKRPYKEFEAKTNRLYNSPLYTYRRRLNDIFTTETTDTTENLEYNGWSD